MNIHLFTINLYFCFFLSFIFLFIIPLLLKNKFQYIIYISIYSIFLLFGVLTKTNISDNTISFNLLITNSWFNNYPILAYFEHLTIIINLFLLFPIGFTLPLLLNKINITKPLLIGSIFSLSIEIFQFLLPIKRSPEVLDILTNTMSSILGFYYFLLTKKEINLFY